MGGEKTTGEAKNDERRLDGAQSPVPKKETAEEEGARLWRTNDLRTKAVRQREKAEKAAAERTKVDAETDKADDRDLADTVDPKGTEAKGDEAEGAEGKDKETAAEKQARKEKEMGLPSQMKSGPGGDKVDTNGIPVGDNTDGFVAQHRGGKPGRVPKSDKDKKERKKKEKKEKREDQEGEDGIESLAAGEKVTDGGEMITDGEVKKKRKKKKSEGTEDDQGAKEDRRARRKERKDKRDAKGQIEAAEDGDEGERNAQRGLNIDVDVNAADVIETVLDHRDDDKEDTSDEAPPDHRQSDAPVPAESTDPGRPDPARKQTGQDDRDDPNNDSTAFRHEQRSKRKANDERSKTNNNRQDGGRFEDVDLGDAKSGNTRPGVDVEKQDDRPGYSRSEPNKAFSFRTTTWWTLRTTGHVLRRSPLLSLLTLVAVVIWVEGSRQLANAAFVASGGSAISSSTPAKRSLDADLKFAGENVKVKSAIEGWSVQGLFVVLNCWIFLSILIVGLLFNWAVKSATSKEGATSRSWFSWMSNTKEGVWWRHPRRSFVQASLGLLHFMEPLLMGAKATGPITFLRRAGWYTYLRVFLFLGQASTTIILVRQCISFTYLVATGSSTTFSKLPDLQRTEGALAGAATAISPSTALIALFLLFGVSVPSMSFACYALFNPRSPASGKTKSGTMILLFQLIASVVVVTSFFGIMYFFGEITSFAAGSGVEGGVYGKNFIIANVIMLVFTPALGWSLMIMWRVVKQVKPGGDGGPNWGCAGLDCTA